MWHLCVRKTRPFSSPPREGHALRGPRGRRLAVYVLLGASLAVPLPPDATSPAQAAPPAASPRPDFDQDGTADLVVSGKDAVVVTYPGTQAHEVLRAPDGDGSEFGSATASGDFNGDGYDDLAVGAPWTTVDKVTRAGSVWVFLGQAHGLLDASGTARRIVLRQGADGLPGKPEQRDQFGYSLASGRLVGNAYDDLAIGSVGESLSGATWAGAVTLVPGGRTGPQQKAARVLSQATRGVAGAPEDYDRFGAALAVGDMTGDGILDLAVSAPGENSVGGVHVLPGTTKGPTGRGSRVVAGTTLGIRPSALSALDPKRSGHAALFGWSLAAGQVTGDTATDLVVGAPYARVGSHAACGAVAVLPGGSAKGARVLSQDTAQVVGTCEQGDYWGWSVALGDLTGDGRVETVVGAHGESIGTVPGAGSYSVLRGTASGPTTRDSYWVGQDSAGVRGFPEASDGFSWSLALRDVDADGRADVLVGVPGEVVGKSPTGLTHILRTNAAGRPGSESSVLVGSDFTDSQGKVYWLGYALGASNAAS